MNSILSLRGNILDAAPPVRSELGDSLFLKIYCSCRSRNLGDFNEVNDQLFSIVLTTLIFPNAAERFRRNPQVRCDDTLFHSLFKIGVSFQKSLITFGCVKQKQFSFSRYFGEISFLQKGYQEFIPAWMFRKKFLKGVIRNRFYDGIFQSLDCKVGGFVFKNGIVGT